MSLTTRTFEALPRLQRSLLRAQWFNETMRMIGEADCEARVIRPSTTSAAVPRAPGALPKKICVLDVETCSVNFAHPEEAQVGIVGIQEHRLVGGVYRPQAYEAYEANELRQLEKYLVGFKGIIVGHNVFQFDYRVLRHRIGVDKLIAKTCDTLTALYLAKGFRLGGAALDDVSMANFGRGKFGKGAAIPELWRRGERTEVLKYNKRDLKLTKDLWWHLVQRRGVVIGKSSFGRRPTRYGVSQDVVDILLCRPALLTYRRWLARINEGKKLMRHTGPVTFRSPKPEDVDPRDLVSRRRCRNCGGPMIELDQDYNDDDMTEGQLAEHMAGNWGESYCPKCGEAEVWQE